MQNNFEAQVWQLKMVFECSIAWCDLGLGRATVHCQRNHPRKPKFSRNRAILSDHFSGVKFYNGLFFGSAFFWFCIGLFQYRQVLLEEQCSQRFQITTTSASDIPTSAQKSVRRQDKPHLSVNLFRWSNDTFCARQRLQGKSSEFPPAPCPLPL